MIKIFKSVKVIVSLVIIAFGALVIFGVYTALDSVGCAETESALAANLPAPMTLEKPDARVNLSTPDEITEVVSSEENEASASKEQLTSEPEVASANNLQNTNGSGDAPAKKSPVWHEPEYRHIERPAEYSTTYHEAEYITTTEFYTQCNDCGYTVQGSIYPHQDSTGHGRYSTEVPFTNQTLKRAAWEETVCTKEAWSEWVLAKEGYWG